MSTDRIDHDSEDNQHSSHDQSPSYIYIILRCSDSLHHHFPLAGNSIRIMTDTISIIYTLTIIVDSIYTIIFDPI